MIAGGQCAFTAWLIYTVHGFCDNEVSNDIYLRAIMKRVEGKAKSFLTQSDLSKSTIEDVMGIYKKCSNVLQISRIKRKSNHTTPNSLAHHGP